MRQETILLRDLSIGYRGKKEVKMVASHINAAVYSGELTCLLGSNGVGKSTLLRTLSAFQPKMGGQVIIQDRDIDTYTDAELSRLIGIVLTEKPDVRNMSVRELVSLGRSPYTGFWGLCTDADRLLVDQAIQMVGIGDLSTRMVHTLSDGERQKVMIAKALAQETPVIYLDEPTAFLDFPSKVEVMQLLRHLAVSMQKTILMSTHDLELALQVADTIWLMDSSTLHVGTPRELADRGVLSLFVERDGIAFDRKSLSVRIKDPQKQ